MENRKTKAKGGYGGPRTPVWTTGSEYGWEQTFTKSGFWKPESLFSTVLKAKLQQITPEMNSKLYFNTSNTQETVKTHILEENCFKFPIL